MGVVSLIWMVYVGNPVVTVSATGMKPESNPVCPVVEVEAMDLHGLAKVDCVTVWFFCWNWKVIVSPGLAVMLLGVKKSFPVPPTTTWWLLLRPGADDVEEAEGYAGYAPLAEVAAAPPPEAFALAWKVARSLPGLTAKTMPDWQCVLCLQYTQTGLRSCTV